MTFWQGGRISAVFSVVNFINNGTVPLYDLTENRRDREQHRTL